MTRLISGPSPAPIAIVGEAPGNDEIAQGSPFVGVSGQLLTKWLVLQGIPRPNCFITNVIGDRIAKVATPADKKALMEELSACSPKTILAVGNVALEALTGRIGITKWRGSVFWHDGLKSKIIPCIHPAGVLRNWDFWPLCVSDVGKLKNPVYKAPKYDFVVEATEADLVNFVQRLDFCNNICIDVETVKDKDDIGYNVLTRIGLGYTHDYGKQIRVISVPVTNLTPLGLKIIDQICKDPRLIKIGHNIAYDWMILAHSLKIFPTKPWFDTMIAFHSLQPELPKALEVVTSLVLDQMMYWKDEASTNQGHYNCLDVYYTLKVFQELKGAVS